MAARHVEGAGVGRHTANGVTRARAGDISTPHSFSFLVVSLSLSVSSRLALPLLSFLSTRKPPNISAPLIDDGARYLLPVSGSRTLTSGGLAPEWERPRQRR